MKLETVPLDTLKPDPSNAREHSKKNLDAIEASLERFGQQKPIVVDETGTVIAGNGTLEAAKALGWKKIAVVRTSLKDGEAIAFALADNRTAELAEWDDRALAACLQQLNDEQMGSTGFAPNDLEELLKRLAPADAENIVRYTKLITTPIYEPSGESPAVESLYDESKSEALRSRIIAAGLGEEITVFLIAAAARHTKFNYHRIADFYCDADPEVQRLMEDSALVIIDFKRAIESGYVNLAEGIAEQYLVENDG